MIGLALSGGGSRAMAFHLGCLRALHDIGLLDRVRVLSTISGGSVIGAYYAYTPGKSFEDFEKDIRGFLRTGFHRASFCRLLIPWNFLRCAAGFAIARGSEIACIIGGREPRMHRFFSRTDVFREVLEHRVFGERKLSDARRNDMDVVIGACELRTGSAFRFGNAISGDWRKGKLVNGDVDVSFAVAASAAYPIFLPALDRTWSFEKGGTVSNHRILLTDGGVYDNLGFQVLEPGRDSTVSLHSFPCEYLIVCNAGQGQEAGDAIPLGSYRRIRRSFEVVHRRVQDSAMGRLHHLKQAGAIKGFVLPYLGQIDERLPWRPSGLVSRAEAIGYPTDFAAMSEEWINKLSGRGEQLTRCLIAQYLPELV